MPQEVRLPQKWPLQTAPVVERSLFGQRRQVKPTTSLLWAMVRQQMATSKLYIFLFILCEGALYA